MDDGDSNNYSSSEYDRIKLLSDQQQTEIKKNPKHCKIVIKKEMKCTVCKNPETGAHSESCSFSSVPTDKKYAYIKERNYNSKDDEDDDDESGEYADNEGEDELQHRTASHKKEKRIITSTTTNAPPTIRRQPSRRQSYTKSPPLYYSTSTRYPIKRSTTISTTLATTKQPRNVGRRYTSQYRVAESRPEPQLIDRPKQILIEPKDDYFAQVFPQSNNGKLQEIKERHDDDIEFLPNYDSMKDVDKVLAEFNKKDWSKCKKEIKDDLTCYHCKDDKGVRHEECVYVSGTVPTSSRIAYSQTMAYTSQPDEEASTQTANPSEENEENKNNSTKRKLAKKLVIRKRKAKLLQTAEPNDSELPRVEDVDDNRSAEKKSIKRTVFYRFANQNNQLPPVAFEHKIVHIV